MSMIPSSHQDLLDRPLFAHLATIRPDGTPQVNPMWMRWDGEHIRFTSTSTRRKLRNIVGNPAVSLSVNDPDQPYRFLELRGRVERIEPDPGAEEFTVLAARYGRELDGQLPPDAPHRVVLLMIPEHAAWQ